MPIIYLKIRPIHSRYVKAQRRARTMNVAPTAFALAPPRNGEVVEVATTAISVTMYPLPLIPSLAIFGGRTGKTVLTRWWPCGAWTCACSSGSGIASSGSSVGCEEVITSNSSPESSHLEKPAKIKSRAVIATDDTGKFGRDWEVCGLGNQEEGIAMVTWTNWGTGPSVRRDRRNWGCEW